MTSVQILADLGIASNRHVLSCNGGLIAVPHDFDLPDPWALPSRLFRFPIETCEEEEGDNIRIGIVHPALADHPFVRHVETLLGHAIDRKSTPNGHGYSRRATAQWWHSVDLVTAHHWQDLLATRHFTTDENIARAVVFGLIYSDHNARRMGYITIAQARAMLAAIGADELRDRRQGILSLLPPSPCKPEGQAAYWPINHPPMPANTLAWAIVHGIEDGWFAHDRSGFLHWTATGRDRYAAGDSDSFTEASGQAAFTF